MGLEDLRADFSEPIETIESMMKSYSNRFENLPIRFVPSLARGMGYYTGAIFEFKLKTGGGSLGGGGRYDRLIGRFTQQETPAVGCSIGFERLLIYLEENQYFEKISNTLFFPIFEKRFFESHQSLAKQIRQAGIKVDLYADESKMKHQFRYADAKNYRWVLIAGDEEWSKNTFKLKDMKEGHEIEVTASELISKLQSLGLVDL
jgi:histidyl-tRNA synthetase